MTTSNLEHRKIDFIQHFLKINSSSTLEEFETLMAKERKKLVDNISISPMSLNEFNKRIDKAEEDDLQGRLTDVDELLKNIDSWT